MKKNKELEGLVKIIKDTQHNIEEHMPIFDAYVHELIAHGETDYRKIEPILDTLSGCIGMNIGNDIYNKLYKYYKVINPKNAKFYKV